MENMVWEKYFETPMLEVYLSGQIAKLVLNRPELHNAFNPQFMQELIQSFQKLEEDEKVRVVILTGAGKSFCAGADLNWMKEMNQYTSEENIADSRKLALLFQKIQEFKKPLIGQINGAAMGGGVGMVSVCDVVIAQERAKFAFSEVKLGLIPAVISPYAMKKIGYSQSRRLMLSGEIFLASFAKEIGLVHEVCSLEELEEKAYQTAQTFFEKWTEAMAHVKLLLNQLTEAQTNQEVQELTAKAIAERRVSEEGQEGIRALLEKSTPSFASKETT